MAELTDGERVISRARTLMATRGYGWSKAIDVAAQTLESSRTQTQPGAAHQRPSVAQKSRDGQG